MNSATTAGGGGIYVLDTSVLILSIRGDMSIRARLASATKLYIPSITLGELYVGAYGSPTRQAAALTEVDTLANANTILGTDATTAQIFGHTKQDLKRRGLTMPDNDLWIAATAIQYGPTLAARDAHFDWITGLSVEQW